MSRQTARLLLPALLLLAGTSPRAAAAEETLLIAPMLEGLSLCREALDDPAILDTAQATARCREQQRTPSALIEAALDAIGPRQSPSGRYALGYTLSVTLFDHLRREGSGWRIDRASLAHSLRPLQELDRQAVVYLFSNHFSNTGDAAVSAELARDPRNLMATRDGPLPPDGYFESRIHAWSLDPEAPVNRLRAELFKAALEELCRLPPAAREHVTALTLLGEAHHMFPNFFSGMGYGAPYRQSDYSAASVAGFQQWLRQRAGGNIAALNAELGASYADFAAVRPPSRDIRTERLQSFLDHIDPFAHGLVPVHGWARDLKGGALRAAIHLDGVPLATVPVDLNRLDVLEAKPEFGTPSLGFRYELNFAALAPGIHEIAVYILREGDAPPLLLSRQELVVMGRDQAAPRRLPVQGAMPSQPMGSAPDIQAWLDSPGPLQSLYYNPLARLWLEYRNWQVQHYLEHFAGLARASCLPAERIYSHQIAPGFNSSWNPNWMAVEASLRPNPNYHLGLNLYGASTSSPHFRRWLGQQGIETYGVPEFHPMTALPPEQVVGLLERHRSQGARFIAPYYVSLLPQRMLADTPHARFQLQPGRAAYGSGAFLAGLQALMRQ